MLSSLAPKMANCLLSKMVPKSGNSIPVIVIIMTLLLLYNNDNLINWHYMYLYPVFFLWISDGSCIVLYCVYMT
jgi:hypothetical protein